MAVLEPECHRPTGKLTHHHGGNGSSLTGCSEAGRNQQRQAERPYAVAGTDPDRLPLGKHELLHHLVPDRQQSQAQPLQHPSGILVAMVVQQVNHPVPGHEDAARHDTQESVRHLLDTAIDPRRTFAVAAQGFAEG